MIRKFFVLLLLSANVQAFDVIKLDQAVSAFLRQWYSECENIEYSYREIVYIGLARERGYYGDSEPTASVPPTFLKDVDVEITTSICGWDDGYFLSMRKNKDGSYRVVGYSSFTQSRIYQLHDEEAW